MMGDKTKHLVRVGHEFAAAMSDDTPSITIAKMVTELASALDVQSARSDALAAENAAKTEFIQHCFRTAAEGGSLDGADIQELGERLGLFSRETYQPALHGYICGHEAGEDTVYVMEKSVGADEWVNEQRAVGATQVETNLRACYGEFPESSRDIVDECIQIAASTAAQLRGSQV
ncbi:hypothetical protein [Atlantibacter subterraneus]|uniref:hypothetical protein n=1 Tax=Atlantibacter subterraneus TaxID=255519 RepID=UPI002963C92B|nr:hypothetical protein [Atlantibacter subterranea]MDW2743677.1 hypothetical protein [Atlantibacter subterranea]